MATVLVVDDDPISRDFLRTLLGYRGHQICEAADGDSALTLAWRQPPDAVITDVLMPGLDGYELARTLRSQPATRHIPIAFSTAHYGQQEIQPLAETCGVQEVIFKPAQPDTVLATIDALLGVGRLAGPDRAGASSQQFADQHRQALKTKLLEKTGALRLTEGRLHAIATTAPVGVFLADGAGSASYVNPRLSQILGQPEVTLLGTGWLDRLEPAGRDRLLASLAAGAVSEASVEHTLAGRPHRVATTPIDADSRWLDICLHRVDDAVAGDIIGIVEDVTVVAQSRQNMRAADDRAARSRRLAAYLADRLTETHHLTRSGTWDLDLETGTIIVSPDLRDLLRLPSARVCCEQLSQRVHPDDLAKMTTMAEGIWRTGSPGIAELRIADMDGAVHELIVSCRKAKAGRKSSGSRRKLWGVAQDVTQIRQTLDADLHAQVEWHAGRRAIDLFHRAVLPRTLPVVAGVDLAAIYLSAPEWLDIGAGWYDALPVRDGGVLLSVGEVAGHEQPAAAVAGQVVAALRAYAVEDPDPARMLARLNRLLTSTRQDDVFVTAIVALYDPDTGHLSLANAGHPTPLVVTPDRDGCPVVAPLTQRGPALGISPDADFAGQHLTLIPGAALCAYTDGLTDRHNDPTCADTQRLPLVVAQAFGQLTVDHLGRTPAAQHLAETIVGEMFGANPPDDDVCVAVLWAAPEDA